MNARNEKSAQKPGRLLAVILLACVIPVGLMAWLFYQHQEKEFIRAAHETLAAIADLKVNQIAHWYNERRGDAEVIFNNPMVLTQARQFLADPAKASVRADLARWMEAVRREYNYSRVALYDAQGIDRLSVLSDQVSVDGHLVENSQAALRAKNPIATDLHRGQSNQAVHMSFWIPVGIKSGADQLAEGAFLLQIDPQQFLYPLLQTWPTPSRSVETLLVRREGDEVVFLNELRHRTNTALRLRFPLSRHELLAVKAVRGTSGIVEGRDYRGIPVLGAVEAVEGTPWFMVAKVDREEILAPLRERARITGIVALLLALAGCLAIFLFWNQWNLRFVTEQLAAERSNKALAERFEHLMRHAEDIILLADEHWRILEANDSALATYGYSLAELRDMSMPDLWTPRARQDWRHHLEQMQSEGHALFETVHQRKDGSAFPVEISGNLVRIGGVNYMLGVLRDITERKQQEEEIRRLNRLYATLSQVNQAVVRVQSRDELLRKICHIAVVHGGFAMAWIGWLDSQTKAVRPIAWAGDVEDHLSGLEVYTDYRSEGDGLTGAALRIGKPYVSNDYLQDSRRKLPATAAGAEAAASRWHDLVVAKGFQSAAAFPFRFQGELCGALMLYVEERDFFKIEEIELLEEVSLDISFALDQLKKEEQRIQAEEALRQQTEELRARNEELTRFNRVAVGRELRMIELKQEVNELCRRLGEPPCHAMSLPPADGVPSAVPAPVPQGGGGP